MRRTATGLAVLALGAAPLLIGSPPGAGASESATTGEQEYVVVFAEDTSSADAHAAIAAAGGTIVRENTDVGVATIVTTNADFAAAAAAAPAIEGTAENRVIGAVPENVGADGLAEKFDPATADLADLTGGGAAGGGKPSTPAQGEPLAALQWDMQQIGATPTGSYKHEQGKGVRVGIIDTGVDGTHPDIAPNFDATLSRNFTTDIPVDANGDEIDGPCEYAGCVDPNNVDDDGHGTHVASTIASPINGIGIAGVAPRATIVNLRAGQDSGYFFLQPSVDALTYAGTVGIDVVNMSYYVDPWLFNCQANPADSPEDQAEQRTIITAMQRALDFAFRRGVTLVAAAGNGGTDYTKTVVDASSPDFASTPGEAPYPRTIDPATCISMPTEGNHVLSVSSTGPSTRKAYYSDYGNGYVDLSAPGGDVYDTPGNTRDISKAVLAAYPEALALSSGLLDPNGEPLPGTPLVRNCVNGTCAYYQYLQGTSMASPHAAGVAALAVGRWGLPDRRNGGKWAFPDVIEFVLRIAATDTACPVPPAFTYTRNLPSGATVTATHTCEGTRRNNGFYGDGIVSALRVARGY